MRIYFKHVDEEYYGVQEYISPIADLASTRHQFICIVCEILNVFHTYSNNIVVNVKKALQCFEYRLDKVDEHILSDYTKLSDLMEKFYWNIVDDDFGEKIRTFNEQQYWNKKLRYPDMRLGRYRGLLFEELVTAIVKTKFTDRTFCTGCQIYINGCRILAHYGEGSAFHKETIDIAGWDDFVRYGEFYECKISPERFDNENYRFFMEIQRTLDNNVTSQYIIGLVSAEATEHVKAQKRYLEEQDENCKADFKLIGREDIYNIKKYTIPEIR